MKLRKPFRILRNLILFSLSPRSVPSFFYRFVPVYVTPTYDYPLCPATRFGRKSGMQAYVGTI